MLNEQFLHAVSGGKPFIELIGKLAQWTTRVGAMIVGGSIGKFDVHDSMGQSGTMKQVNGILGSQLFGATGFAGKETEIKVLNADNMKDLGGVKVAVGITATLPQAMQEKLSLQHSQCFGIAYEEAGGKTGVGGSVSVPIMSQTGKYGTDGLQVTFDRNNPTYANCQGAGMRNFGIELHGALQFNQVKVDHVDHMAHQAYMEMMRISSGAPCCYARYNSDGTACYNWQTPY